MAAVLPSEPISVEISNDIAQHAVEQNGVTVTENGNGNDHVEVEALEQQVNGISIRQQQPFDSDLHRFCAEGKLDEVRVLLSRSLEGLEVVEMTTGCTPIVLAIQNNHPDVVRELLSAGAIVPPPGLTSDPLLNSILYPQIMYGMPPQFIGGQIGVPPQDFFPQGYYPEAQRGGMYMPYPGQSPAQLHLRKEGSPNGQGGVHNLPPAEVAKTIPCRNFPNCKYGPSCVFLHPRPGFFPGPSPMNNGNFIPNPSYDQYGYQQPGMTPFFPHDFNQANFQSRPMIQDPTNGQPQQQQQQQQQQQIPQENSEQPVNTQHDSIPSSTTHVPSALTPAFVPSFQPQQQQLDPQAAAIYMTSPPPASQYGLSPMSPSLLTSPPPQIPTAEAFYAATSPPNNSSMMLPPSAMGMINGQGNLRRQSFNQQAFGIPGKTFGHSKKPSFSNGGPKPSWMGRPSLGGANGASANLGSWKDGNPPPCAFYSQAKCRNGDYCKFPHLDAEGNDCRHPDVVRGIIPPAPSLSRQPRSSMRMMPPANFGPFDPAFRQQQAQQQLHFLQQQKIAAAQAQLNGNPASQTNGDSAIVTQETESSVPATTETEQPASTSSTMPVLPASVPAKPAAPTQPSITRSASQPGINRSHANGVISRAHSPAPSNVSFHGNGHPRRAGSRVPYPNGLGNGPVVNGINNGNRSASSQSADAAKKSIGIAQQRVPGADDFPALGGVVGSVTTSSTPTHEKKEPVFVSGKTAAQVLSEPAPPKPVSKVTTPEEEVDSSNSSGSQSGGSQGVIMDSESESDAVLISRKTASAITNGNARSAPGAAKPEIKRASVSFASVASSVGLSAASAAMESAPLVKA